LRYLKGKTSEIQQARARLREYSGEQYIDAKDFYLYVSDALLMKLAPIVDEREEIIKDAVRLLHRKSEESKIRSATQALNFHRFNMNVQARTAGFPNVKANMLNIPIIRDLMSADVSKMFSSSSYVFWIIKETLRENSPKNK
jgi:hypothetical protein